MAPKRAQVTPENAQSTLGGGGILDRLSTLETTPVAVQEIPIVRIEPNPFQPRQSFDEETLAELADSIRVHGFYGHLLVREQGRRYQLAYGERRLRAARQAGLETVPAQIRDLDDAAMLEIALTENVQRDDLQPVDEARAYARLQAELGYSVREIAGKIGKSSSYVGSLLSIVRYPDIEAAVRAEGIPVRTAEELAKIEEEAERRRLTAQVIARKLDREGLIALRRGERVLASGQGVRTADSARTVHAFSRIYRTLAKRTGQQIEPAEREETAQILKQIIQRATALLQEIEEGSGQ